MLTSRAPFDDRRTHSAAPGLDNFDVDVDLRNVPSRGNDLAIQAGTWYEGAQRPLAIDGKEAEMPGGRRRYLGSEFATGVKQPDVRPGDWIATA